MDEWMIREYVQSAKCVYKFPMKNTPIGEFDVVKRAFANHVTDEICYGVNKLLSTWAFLALRNIRKVPSYVSMFLSKVTFISSVVSIHFHFRCLHLMNFWVWLMLTSLIVTNQTFFFFFYSVSIQHLVAL